jgi:hypothetical protein
LGSRSDQRISKGLIYALIKYVKIEVCKIRELSVLLVFFQ